MLSVMVVVQILTRRADSLIMASSDVLGSVGRSKVLSWGSTLFGQAEKNRTCWSVVFPRAPPKIHGILLIFHHFPHIFPMKMAENGGYPVASVTGSMARRSSLPSAEWRATCAALETAVELGHFTPQNHENRCVQ